MKRIDWKDALSASLCFGYTLGVTWAVIYWEEKPALEAGYDYWFSYTMAYIVWHIGEKRQGEDEGNVVVGPRWFAFFYAHYLPIVITILGVYFFYGCWAPARLWIVNRIFPLPEIPCYWNVLPFLGVMWCIRWFHLADYAIAAGVGAFVHHVSWSPFGAGVTVDGWLLFHVLLVGVGVYLFRLKVKTWGRPSIRLWLMKFVEKTVVPISITAIIIFLGIKAFYAALSTEEQTTYVVLAVAVLWIMYEMLCRFFEPKPVEEGDKEERPRYRPGELSHKAARRSGWSTRGGSDWLSSSAKH